MPKMSGYVKTFKFEDKNNKSISFLINLFSYKRVMKESI